MGESRRRRSRLVAVLCLLAGVLGVGGPAGADQGESAAQRVAAASITTGYGRTCVLSTMGKVLCWRNGADGRLAYDIPFDVGATATSIPAAGDVPVGPSALVRATTHLSARVRPARAHSAPYVYRVTGRLAGRFVRDRATCTGRVTLTVRHGHQRLKRRTTRLGAHCRYRFRIRLSAFQLPADHTVRLSFHLRYRGSPNLTPAATTRYATAR